MVVADEPRIRQVLANLLGNVREHTSPDTPVTVRLARAGQGALLEVTDSGQGMDEEAAARAFDRFYRGGHNGNNGHGSGLGLSIVQAIAAAHGGHAMLKSAQGNGTSVQVWIPFHPPAADSEHTMPRNVRLTDLLLVVCYSRTAHFSPRARRPAAQGPGERLPRPDRPRSRAAGQMAVRTAR